MKDMRTEKLERRVTFPCMCLMFLLSKIRP